jgi:ABC-type transport system substrate-binding protein
MAVEEGLSLDSRLFRDLMGKTERLTEDTNEIVSEVFDNIKVIDQYTVEYNLLEPTPDLDYVMSSRLGTTFAMSKLHWDSEGLKGYTDSPIGTGSWQYVGRKLSQYLELERVENHWEKTPDFKGLKLWWVGEPATRLAQLLAGEVQMATLPTSLYGQATGKGMVIFSSSAPANQVVLLFGGLYADDSEFYDPDHPFHNVKVREAINRSLNRDEMNRELFGGNGEVLYNQGFHPSQAGWNPDWEKNFERDYGYDPVRARELIAEAGYAPGEIKVQSLVTALAQLPEMGEIGEAMAIYMQDIGLDVEILELEFAAVVKIQRAGGLGGILVNLPGALHPPGKSISVFSLGFKRVPWSETTFIRDKYTEFLTILDPVERERRLLEMGQYKYDNYVEVPLFWLSGDVLADPAIIKDHHFSGGIAGSYTHWEYVEAVQK